MGKKLVFTLLLLLLLINSTDVLAQGKDDPPIEFQKSAIVTISNPLNSQRDNVPVKISVSEIKKYYPDFNVNAFRLKYEAFDFEPLDIPSQVLSDGDSEEIAFMVFIGPKEKKHIFILYNVDGTISSDYTNETQAFEKWYSDGSNIAWENKLIAYRSYNGVMDFFGKSYQHLRLHDLAPDSYHHERFWGIDPFVIGKKPGLAGLIYTTNDGSFKLYGNENGNKYEHKMISSGPVMSLVSVKVTKDGKAIDETKYALWGGNPANYAETNLFDDSGIISVGMQKFDNEKYILNKKDGYMLMKVCPLKEYGEIGSVLVWNPELFESVSETVDGHFVKLRKDDSGKIKYISMAVWYRGSDKSYGSVDCLEKKVRILAQEFRNPLKVKIGDTK